ncbi:helix-turn-helix domain-containing protein [Paenibacillus xylanexedens]|uniref:helix-turn-helix domain-containing protein n=1 Tax=Paenibacillus xylanexedens TaxID=528191 RepID=UPI0011A41888|nr:helix-turn-helix domain-containing protein [Paenibacillus xylanexedens]
MSDNMEWIAQWKSTNAISNAWITKGELHHFFSHTLIFIIDGKAIWNINGHRVHVSYGELIALEENSVMEVVEGGNLDLAGWHVQFDTYSVLHERREAEKFEWHVPSGEAYQKVQLSGGSLASIIQHWSEEDTQEQSAGGVGHQHLLYALLKNLYRKPEDNKRKPEHGILRSIDYMQQHYDQVITRMQLAQIAGISPWHYSRKFSERYGKPPLDYLAHYRIYRAQEELILTDATSQDIAKKSGFEDAHYFSRRFKQLTGVSPKRYRQTMNGRKIVSLSPICAEMMIHLGVIPHAVVVTPILLSPHHREQFIAYGVQMLEVAQYEVEIDLVRQVQPEIMIGNVLTEEVKRELRTIAPILTGLHPDVEPLLHQLAAWFFKEEKAHRLHQQMKHEVRVAKQQLQHIIQSASTVMLLRVEAFGYRYLGGHSHGASQLLYEQLGLALPQALQSGTAWFNPCSLDLLAQANPDYLFVEKRIMQHFSAEENMTKLWESPLWNDLKAVKNNRVYYVDTHLWVDGHGITGHTLILNQIIRNLTETNPV